MTKRLIFARVVLGFLVLGVASQAKLAGQPLECPAAGAPELLKAIYAVYSDAKELALTLSGYGFIVKCIARSKWDDFVPGAKGAALYLTDHGDFDVVFLPKPLTFDGLDVIERQTNGEYEYSFRGSPRPASRMAGRKRTYFFKHSNQLFMAWNLRTATNLARVLGSQ